MSRHLLGLFAVLVIAAAVVLAIARPGALSNQGSFAQPVAAVADTEPSATPWAYIDKVNNGAGWCDPGRIDSTTTEYVGDNHQLAICLGNLPGAVTGFTAAITYDGALDQCVDTLCHHVVLGFGSQTALTDGEGCLDDNPDANAGVTVWGDGLGSGWTCSPLQGDQYQAFPFALSEPVCDLTRVAVPVSTENTAWIHCEGDGDYALGDNEEWGALAVLTLGVIGVGTDNVNIDFLDVALNNGPGITCSEIDLNADSIIDIPCQGATDIKQQRHRATPTLTPEATATPEEPTVPPPPSTVPPPPAAPTPFGGAGPAIVAPATGSGPSAGGAPWATWLAAGVVGAAAATGGLYLRRRTR
jgi:hypothetical protein